jgi:signal transduction histidine kinase
MQAMEAVTFEDRVLGATWDPSLGVEPSDPRFTRFFPICAAGTGLSIFRSISQSQKGRILASSNDRLGTSFQFTLPLSSENIA